MIYLSDEVRAFQIRPPFVLEEDTFLQCFRISKRGVVGGPSGMTVELTHSHDSSILFRAAEELSRGNVPVRRSRRNIVLASRAMAQQWGEAFGQATALFQNALSTRAGCDCVSHLFQGSPLTTCHSHSCFREGNVGGPCVSDGATMPFVGSMGFLPKTRGKMTRVLFITSPRAKAEGDALVPVLLLFAQHSALIVVEEDLRPSDLDNIVCAPNRVATIYSSFQKFSGEALSVKRFSAP